MLLFKISKFITISHTPFDNFLKTTTKYNKKKSRSIFNGFMFVDGVTRKVKKVRKQTTACLLLLINKTHFCYVSLFYIVTLPRVIFLKILIISLKSAESVTDFIT